MKSSVIPLEAGYPVAVNVPSGGVELLDSEEVSSLHVPHHPLGLKPLGNQYAARSNAKNLAGHLRILPDEVLVILLEYLQSPQLKSLGSTCKYLYACCRIDELWKTLLIE